MLSTYSLSFPDWQLSKCIARGLVDIELYSETVFAPEIRSVNALKMKVWITFN